MNKVQKVYDSAYDIGTGISQAANRFLGDRTGRTITSTTQDGIEALTEGKYRPSGFVTHALMAGSIGCLFSNNKTLRTAGLVGLLGIVGSYSAGRKNIKLQSQFH